MRIRLLFVVSVRLSSLLFAFHVWLMFPTARVRLLVKGAGITGVLPARRPGP